MCLLIAMFELHHSLAAVSAYHWPSESKKALFLFLIVPLAVEHYSRSNGTIRNSNGALFFSQCQCNAHHFDAARDDGERCINTMRKKKAPLEFLIAPLELLKCATANWTIRNKNRAFPLSEHWAMLTIVMMFSEIHSLFRSMRHVSCSDTSKKIAKTSVLHNFTVGASTQFWLKGLSTKHD